MDVTSAFQIEALQNLNNFLPDCKIKCFIESSIIQLLHKFKDYYRRLILGECDVNFELEYFPYLLIDFDRL